jgi:hypothetical protein
MFKLEMLASSHKSEVSELKSNGYSINEVVGLEIRKSRIHKSNDDKLYYFSEPKLHIHFIYIPLSTYPPIYFAVPELRRLVTVFQPGWPGFEPMSCHVYLWWTKWH